jgi:hypothetical protein
MAGEYNLRCDINNMSVLIKKHMSYYFSSNPSSGAENVSANGSQFSVSLNSPIQIPSSAVVCEVGVSQASIWNTSFNIASEFGNNIFEFTTGNAGNPGTHTITIIDGLYSLEGLNSFLSIEFSNLGLPSGLITISGDDATQRTVLTFSDAGDQVDFTVANSCRNILGFNARLSPATPQAAGYSDYSDNAAAFNRNNDYIIRTA